jgi:zinc protease
VPNSATLVIVGDVDTKTRCAASSALGDHPGHIGRRTHTREPEQLVERRLTLSREGTTAYLKLGYRAPAAGDADFFPMLVLDAVLTGAKGLNLWASFRTPAPQRSARLYRELVDAGLASSVMGGLVPTSDPFLYTISMTATDGVRRLARLEETVLAELDRVRLHGVTEAELERPRVAARAWCSRTTASRTSAINSATSRPLRRGKPARRCASRSTRSRGNKWPRPPSNA